MLQDSYKVLSSADTGHEDAALNDENKFKIRKKLKNQSKPQKLIYQETSIFDEDQFLSNWFKLNKTKF